MKKIALALVVLVTPLLWAADKLMPAGTYGVSCYMGSRDVECVTFDTRTGHMVGTRWTPPNTKMGVLGGWVRQTTWDEVEKQPKVEKKEFKLEPAPTSSDQ